MAESVVDNAANRSLITQLSEDLGWLEQHCRSHSDQSAHVGHLRLAAAAVRNCIGPFLDGQRTGLLHLAVVGGAGAGKSTIANVLSGANVAESNPQAGFTRHPVAFSTNGAAEWSGHLGFLGNLQRLHEISPSNLDADVYQVRRVSANGRCPNVLDRFVVWDCPDMTTWASTSYAPRLLEIAALADVVVYVASDERYNDEVPTQFLHQLLYMGKSVVACLMKMKESDADAMIDHFRREVLGPSQAGSVPCLAIPFLSPVDRSDPCQLPAKYRIPLMNQVSVLGDPPNACRQRTVRWGMKYLVSAQEKLLSVARDDITALHRWRQLVQDGQVEFDSRYRREYLTSEKFHRFDEALVRLIELLELPGVGRTISNVLWVVRTPYRLLKAFFTKALERPEGRPMPEQPILEQALGGWLDALHKESAHRAATHPLWAHIDRGFETDLPELVRARFEQGFRAFQLSQAEEVERTARSIYEELEKRPTVLNTLRGGKAAVDIAAVVTAVVTGGHSWTIDLLLVPLAASISQQLVEILGSQYVDTQRERARSRQQMLVSQYVSAPLAEWLAQWPVSGGTSYERLHLALRRIPPAIEQLHGLVEQTLSAAEKKM